MSDSEGSTRGATSHPPRLRVFAGPNGSGKSTFLSLLRPEWLGAYVNADDIERQLKQTGSLDLSAYGLQAEVEDLAQRFRQHLAESRLLMKHGLQDTAGTLTVDADQQLRLPFASVNSYVAAVLADAIRRQLLAQGSTFTFETVMSSPDKIDFMHEARARGYRTYLYFVATDDPAIKLARVALRVAQGGHDVPEDRVRQGYRRSIDLLDAACAAADRAYVFDNSGEAHEWLVELVDGDQLLVRSSVLPAWFTDTALWRAFQDDTPQDSARG